MSLQRVPYFHLPLSARRQSRLSLVRRGRRTNDDFGLFGASSHTLALDDRPEINGPMWDPATCARRPKSSPTHLLDRAMIRLCYALLGSSRHESRLLLFASIVVELPRNRRPSYNKIAASCSLPWPRRVSRRASRRGTTASRISKMARGRLAGWSESFAGGVDFHVLFEMSNSTD
ncbi:uncharacterized protein SCHCODRAFT_02627954 [Schizophyllum commune H4-8]|uniref:uncharacterized protein n=1 Tax=Schizophyllum commune (strain H4-8 / FGSC 9210) TaxID=578458 RepID=UPI00215E581D|nr:uncharacterized protein SCHCODRAFT_02627954 [Schizophyllum commune H4-8]KAI5891035.1 hypothetical protein SCHCODRAFT_02627954 [Schizophyllum commune H4-8]